MNLTLRRTGRRFARVGSLPVVLALGLAAAACGDASARAGSGDGAAPTLVPGTEEVYRIGSVDGASWESFSRIVAAGFDARGNLYLLDADARRVTKVDASGGFVRTIGQAGDGPGEYRNPMSMAVMPDGRVLVSDFGHRGFLLFDAEGAFDRTIPFGEGAGAATIALPHGDDGVVFASRGVTMSASGGGPPQMASDLPIRRLGLAPGGEAEVVHRAWAPPREPPQFSMGAGGGMPAGMRGMMRAFEPTLHVAVLPDGTVAVADSAAYRIDIVRPGHGVEETLDRPVAPRPVSDRERELEKARRLQELQDGGGPQIQISIAGPGGTQTMNQSQLRPMLEAQIESLEFWPEIPVIQQLAADREGRLWVRRFGDVGEAGPIEILGRDGALRAVVPAGTFSIPTAFGPDGLAAWIERDDLDVPFVRVARLSDIP